MFLCNFVILILPLKKYKTIKIIILIFFLNNIFVKKNMKRITSNTLPLSIQITKPVTTQ
jgi:hypothetical protein